MFVFCVDFLYYQKYNIDMRWYAIDNLGKENLYEEDMGCDDNENRFNWNRSGIWKRSDEESWRYEYYRKNSMGRWVECGWCMCSIKVIIALLDNSNVVQYIWNEFAKEECLYENNGNRWFETRS